ncbi:hypothetical protein AVEN_193384-1 [Araneus ventricosus]|uniref:Uncharacterized protein n=1 Tax=Araneus ventricosus TaxID=182803 RepID=A0A4Y2FC71_ARAVE|nr:hypothetical protein AVEN_193384-1 [Araneus ventricosus]
MNASSTPTRTTPDPSSLNNPSPLTSCFVTQKKRINLATSVVYVLDNSGAVRKGRATEKKNQRSHSAISSAPPLAKSGTTNQNHNRN